MMQTSGAPWAVLLLAALVAFWLVGTHNRLVALRNGITAARGQIEQALRHRSAVVLPLVQALREPLVAEQGALDAFLGAHAMAEQAAAVLGTKPVAMAAAAAHPLVAGGLWLRPSGPAGFLKRPAKRVPCRFRCGCGHGALSVAGRRTAMRQTLSGSTPSAPA